MRARIFSPDGGPLHDSRFILMRNQVLTRELPAPGQVDVREQIERTIRQGIVRLRPGKDLPSPNLEELFIPGESFAEVREVMRSADFASAERINKDGKLYQVFVTHLGNGGPMFQVEDLLRRVQGLDNVIAMGDFNLRPAADQYALLTQTLSDSWLLKRPGEKETLEFSQEKRIDYIFVSPGTTVLESEYKVNSASDHPYLYTVIEP